MSSPAPLSAVRAASRLRVRLGLGNGPICPEDCADRLGIEVRYVSISSLEGMYLRSDPPRVFVGADRPRGRQAMTIAHELGHHVLGHRIHVSPQQGDHLRATRSLDEQEADRFAAHLLMPRRAVMRAFEERHYAVENPQPTEIVVVSGWLGVSYDALVVQLVYGFGLISVVHETALRRCQPKQVRRSLLELHGIAPPDDLAQRDVVVVDTRWGMRALDLRVGDIAIVPFGTTVMKGQLVVRGVSLIALKPGIGRISFPDGQILFVRACRRGYVGLARYRHIEEFENGEEDS